jgi:hypothetical protein
LPTPALLGGFSGREAAASAAKNAASKLLVLEDAEMISKTHTFELKAIWTFFKSLLGCKRTTITQLE